MKKARSSSTILIFLGILIFFVFIVLSFLILRSFNLKGVSPVVPDDIGQHEPPPPEKISEVSLLIEKLPHKGSGFSLAYDYDTALFYFYIDPNNQAAGSAGLDAFLEQNGIDDKSQIPGLEESGVPLPTPAP